MGWARNVARMWKRRGVYRVWMGETWWRDYLEDLRVDGMIIFKWIFRKYYWVVDCIDLAEDRDRWRAVVKTVMNLWVPWNWGNYLTSWGLVRFSRKDSASWIWLVDWLVGWLEHGNEIFGSLQCSNFFTSWGPVSLSKEDSAPWNSLVGWLVRTS